MGKKTIILMAKIRRDTMTEKMLISSTIRNQIIRSTTRKIMVSTMKKSIKKPVIRKVACPETKGMFSIPEHKIGRAHV